MKRFISKSLSRSAESESEENLSQSAYEKRRAQVRKAQRKHRDRKATYLKALEIEVVNLRADNQLHKDEVTFLRRVLQESNIVPPPWQPSQKSTTTSQPPRTKADLDFNTSPTMLTVSKESGLGKPLQIAFPQGSYTLETGQPIGMLDVSMNGSVTTSPGMNSDVSGITAGMQDMGSNAYTDMSSAYSQSPGNLLQQEPALPDAIDTFIGVDWVLALEHPCMAHFDMICPPFGTHSHMATHQLMQSAPENLQPAAPGSWQVPSNSIQSLLALSSSFQLQGELTPVQAWYRLKMDPRFGKLVQTQLNMLSRLLTNDVKCYGFGAVIDEDLWMLAVEEVLGQTR